MNIILVQPRRKMAQSIPLSPPLGLLSIATFLRRKGYESTIIDLNLRNFSSLLKLIDDSDPTIVGISCNSFTFIEAIRISREIKNLCKDVLVVLGGFHPTFKYEEIMTHYPEIDAIVLGEGEETFTSLVQRISKNESLSRIRGIVYRKRGEVVAIKNRGYLNLEQLPRPDYSLLGVRSYKKYSHVLLESSRGCPFRCAFCSVWKFQGNKVRMKNVEKMLSEIQHAREYSKTIEYVDPNFLVNRARATKFAKALLENHMDIEFIFRARSDSVDHEIVQMLRKAGCRGILLGAESGVPHILDRIEKGLSPSGTRKAVKCICEKGVSVTVDFILGLPGDNKKTISKTIHFASQLKKIDPDMVKICFNILVPLPGTEIYERSKDFDVIILDNKWYEKKEIINKEPIAIIENAELTKDELLSLWVGSIYVSSGATL